MKVPFTRGAACGTLLILLGAWVALIPFVGPLFDYSIGSTNSWDWTMGRFWLNVLPGAVTFAAGLVALGAGKRFTIGMAGWTASIAGIWIVAGPQLSRIWNNGVVEDGTLHGSNNVQVLAMLGYSLIAGGLITAIGAFLLGRNTVASLEDVRYDAQTRERELDSLVQQREDLAARESAHHDVTAPAARGRRHLFTHERRSQRVGPAASARRRMGMDDEIPDDTATADTAKEDSQASELHDTSSGPR